MINSKRSNLFIEPSIYDSLRCKSVKKTNKHFFVKRVIKIYNIFEMVVNQLTNQFINLLRQLSNF